MKCRTESPCHGGFYLLYRSLVPGHTRRHRRLLLRRDGFVGLIGAAAGLIVSAVLVKLYDSSLGKKIDTKATITEIIETEDDES